MPIVEQSVVLVEHTPEPEKLVEIAGQRCTNKGLDGINIGKLSALKTCEDKGHYSVLEHAVFTFHVQGVSRKHLAQITRHRLISFSVMSQRYNNEEEFNYVVPDIVEEVEPRWGKTEYCKDMAIINETYKKWHGKFKKAGYDDKTANENARNFLPNATETRYLMTINGRELLHVFNLRCCYKAEKETRKVAKSMLRQVKEVAPTIFKGAGPPCLRGKCPEGNTTCGKVWQLDDE